MNLKLHCSKNWALPFTSLHKETIPLPHLCALGNSPRKCLQHLVCLTCTVWGCTVMLQDHTLGQIVYFCCLSNTWEITTNFIMRKWQQLFMNVQMQHFIYIVKEFLKLCQHVRIASMCSENEAKNNIISAE
jgi:hypothetical protein